MEATFATMMGSIRLPGVWKFSPAATHTWQIMLLYQCGSILGQMFLINLLIACVAAANMRVKGEAKLVAAFERANYILDQEHDE